MSTDSSRDDVEAGSFLGDSIAALGDWTIFSLQTLGWTFRRRPARGTLARAFYSIGVQTASVVLITGLFIGMVLAVYAYDYLKQFDLTSRGGSAINLAVLRELGPVLVAVMLAGRVGSAMAAELASMRITEQVDALACLGANPIHYLVVPRFVACLLLMPLLTILADFTGVMGGALISINVFQIDAHYYWKHTEGLIRFWDIWVGLIKAMVFGAIIGLISCYRGLYGKHGAEGVGRAATGAFVLSFVVILVVDFFLGLFFTRLEAVAFERSPTAT